MPLDDSVGIHLLERLDHIIPIVGTMDALEMIRHLLHAGRSALQQFHQDTNTKGNTLLIGLEGMATIGGLDHLPVVGVSGMGTLQSNGGCHVGCCLLSSDCVCCYPMGEAECLPHTLEAFEETIPESQRALSSTDHSKTLGKELPLA